MDIATKTATKTVTLTTHSTVVSPDEIAALATVAVKNKIGVGADAGVNTTASRNPDGSVLVEVRIETVVEAQPAADPALGAQVQIPAGLEIP